MARKARVVAPDVLQHIIARGNNRRILFSYGSDYRRYLRYLQQALETSPVRVHQLTLMRNHVHMIVAPHSGAALAALIKNVHQRYAWFRNGDRDGSGKLFEQRYENVPLADEGHLVAAFPYCDSNAYRAGLVESPEAHRWSTCALHCAVFGVSKIPSEIWTPSDWYLSLGKSWSERAAAYRELLRDSLARAAFRDAVARAEGKVAGPYRRRLERPDRSRASAPRRLW